MARPLRIEFSGALYHVTSRGDRREPIYEDDQDRERFLQTLEEVVFRYNWLCHAYCLMDNHYHLVVETPEANLSKGMRQLNGMYTQASNRRHRRGGHLFQGRFKGILVDKENYYLTLVRYVVLNPVRAGMVKRTGAWGWSSYRATAGECPSPAWLATDVVRSYFAKRRSTACQRYRQFVAEGIGQESVWVGLRQQVYLGDEKFVHRMQKKIRVHGDELSIPKVQLRKPPPSLDKIAARQKTRNNAIVAAYATGGYSYREIAEYFGVHLATVGRIVRTRMSGSEK
jgi:putative transposase